VTGNLDRCFVRALTWTAYDEGEFLRVAAQTSGRGDTGRGQRTPGSFFAPTFGMATDFQRNHRRTPTPVAQIRQLFLDESG
jgi:hypothetical protein